MRDHRKALKAAAVFGMMMQTAEQNSDFQQANRPTHHVDDYHSSERHQQQAG